MRPSALGSDSGFGGGVGVIALPGTLALLATRLPATKLGRAAAGVGALLAVATVLSRTTRSSGAIVRWSRSAASRSAPGGR